ncbi:MAG: hypothetical protein ACPGVG_02045 [Mycobacterium sp.]
MLRAPRRHTSDEPEKQPVDFAELFRQRLLDNPPDDHPAWRRYAALRDNPQRKTTST